MTTRTRLDLVLVLSAVASSALSPGRAAAQRQAAPDPNEATRQGPVEAVDALSYGEPVAFHNLSLVPVTTSRKGPFQEYTLLEEGIRAKTLAVRELAGNSAQAQVNALEVQNRGKHPVYLLGGEMVLGGKQDRIIQQDTVVENDGRWTKVPVFCVEQGRWHGQQMRFSASGALAHAKLRRAAMTGSQGAVWAEVARKNTQHQSQSSTQTYRRTIQNAALRARIASYLSELDRLLPRATPLAGLVLAINGRIRIADLFGNPVLFGKLKEKLLAAYVLEALEEQVERGAKPVAKAEAQGWLTKARQAQRGTESKSGRALNYKKDSEGALGSETYDPKTKAPVRETYLSK